LIGVATHAGYGCAPQALMRMADHAPYRAKQLGRQVVGSANDLACAKHAGA
jgi:hypothetical protein